MLFFVKFKASKTKSPSAEINPATSFTVDLSDSEHMPNKHLDIGSSISAFVPSKMRKHFKDRKALSSNTFSKETTSAKNSVSKVVCKFVKGVLSVILLLQCCKLHVVLLYQKKASEGYSVSNLSTH